MKNLNYFFLVLVFLLVGCQSDNVIHLDPNEPPTPISSPTKADIRKDQQMVGLSLREAEGVAKSRNLSTRVVSKNGKDFPVTMDYRSHRVNFSIVKGKVVSVSRG